MIDELRLTIDDLKRRRNAFAAIVTKLNSAIGCLEEILVTETGSPVAHVGGYCEPNPGISPSVAAGPEVPHLADSPLAIEGVTMLSRSATVRVVQPPPAPVRKGGTDSRFKGVKARGKTRYQATAWDKKANHVCHLGRHDDELLAALAVATYLKDAAEIERIKALIQQRADDAEQAENNPVRGLPPAKKTSVAYECNKCGRQHLQAERPKVCEKCGKDHGFREIK